MRLRLSWRRRRRQAVPAGGRRRRLPAAQDMHEVYTRTAAELAELRAREATRPDGNADVVERP